LWIITKIAENRKKIVLTEKQKLELPKKFEYRESTELARYYGVGIK
jgi:hypothetical protein